MGRPRRQAKTRIGTLTPVSLTFATVLANEVGLDDNRIGAITGHNSQGGVLRKVYIDQPTLLARAATVAQFRPPVTLLPYGPGQFSEVLKEAHELPTKWTAQRKKLAATLAAKKVVRRRVAASEKLES